MRLAVLSLLFALLSFQSAYSVDINDLEIEGVQLNKNILNYFNLNLVRQNEKRIKSLYKSKKYKRNAFIIKNAKKYSQIGVHYDDNYNIVAVTGTIVYKNENNNNCLATEKEVVDQLLSSGFKIANGKPGRLYNSRSFKNSKITNTSFKMDGGAIRVVCTFLDSKIKKKYNYKDSLKVAIMTKDFYDWINNKAHK